MLLEYLVKVLVMPFFIISNIAVLLSILIIFWYNLDETLPLIWYHQTFKNLIKKMKLQTKKYNF